MVFIAEEEVQTRKMSQKRWILFFTILIVVMAGLYLFLTNRNTENRYVVISSEGKDVLHIDLETASEDPIVVFDSHYGQNILRVVDGEIFVDEKEEDIEKRVEVMAARGASARAESDGELTIDN